MASLQHLCWFYLFIFWAIFFFGNVSFVYCISDCLNQSSSSLSILGYCILVIFAFRSEAFLYIGSIHLVLASVLLSCQLLRHSWLCWIAPSYMKKKRKKFCFGQTDIYGNVITFLRSQLSKHCHWCRPIS